MTNLGRPFTRGLAEPDPLKGTFRVFMAVLIRHILLMGSNSQVGTTVIKRVPVDMVDVPRGIHSENETMERKVLLVYSDPGVRYTVLR